MLLYVYFNSNFESNRIENHNFVFDSSLTKKTLNGIGISNQ